MTLLDAGWVSNLLNSAGSFPRGHGMGVAIFGHGAGRDVDLQILRGTDWDDAMEPCGRRGVTRTTVGAARRAAAAPARQKSNSESSAPAVPARTCAACAIPANPVGTTPPMRLRPIRPSATLIRRSSRPRY